MLAVGFGTMALVVALSVFNGLEDLLKSLHSTFDPELKISKKLGKSFEVNPEFLEGISEVEGVALVTEVIEDNVYVRYRDSEMVVTLKGVGENFLEHGRLIDNLVYGEAKLRQDGINYAIIGRGVQYALSLNPGNNFYALQLYYPRDIGPGVIDPSRLTRQKNIVPSGIFAVEKQYDENYIFVPIDFAKELLNYGEKRTSLEVKIKDGFSIEKVKKRLKSTLGNTFQVLDREEQHVDVLRVIRIEKFFVFLIFSFILLIASFNIFFSLTMLTLEKKKDVAILFSLGASEKFIKRIFFTEGVLVALVGAFTGLLLGFVICWLQQTFGIISMGMETAILDAYPVKIVWMDFFLTALVIVFITLLASFRPAILATKFNAVEHL